MIRFAILFATFLLLSSSCNTGSGKVWNLTSSEGMTYDLSQEPSYLVVMFIATDCPLSQLYAKSFTALADSFPDFYFFGVVPGRIKHTGELDAFKSEFGFELPLFTDAGYSFSKELNAKVTPQFFVLNPHKKVVYKGAMDDWAVDLARKKMAPDKHYLPDALAAISAGREIRIRETDAIGCIIEYDAH